MLSVACFVFQVTQTPPLFVKSEVDVARVALPSGWFTIILLVILVNVNEVVACAFIGMEHWAAVLAVCEQTVLQQPAWSAHISIMLVSLTRQWVPQSSQLVQRFLAALCVSEVAVLWVRPLA